MLCLIPIVGGLPIMMGPHDRSEALFYYLRLEDQVPGSTTSYASTPVNYGCGLCSARPTLFAWRRGELLGIKVGQLNLAENTISLADSKNGDPRVVVLTPEVRTLLAALAQGKKPDDFVFTRSDGQRMRDFRGSWEKMFEDAGAPLCLFHDLRRSGVRNLVRAGIHRDTCMKISGHRTDSTFRRYNIVSLTDFEEAAEKIAARASRLRAAAEEAAANATKTATPPDQRADAQDTIQ